MVTGVSWLLLPSGKKLGLNVHVKLERGIEVMVDVVVSSGGIASNTGDAGMIF